MSEPVQDKPMMKPMQTPRTPTPEMRKAGEHAWMNRNLRDPDSDPIRDCWMAMWDQATSEERGVEIMKGLEGHDRPCEVCSKPCNALAANPYQWPTLTNHDTYSHIGCVGDAIRAFKDQTDAFMVLTLIASETHELSQDKIVEQRDFILKLAKEWRAKHRTETLLNGGPINDDF